MRNIRNLVQELKEERPNEFNAFLNLDKNTNELLGRIKKLEEKNLGYYVAVNRETDQILPISTPTSIVFSRSLYPQIGNMWDVTSTPSLIYIRRTGLYVCTCNIRYTDISEGLSGAILTSIIKYKLPGGNFTICQDWYQHPAGLGLTIYSANLTVIDYLYEGSYVYLNVFHNTSSDTGQITAIAGGETYPTLRVMERREDLDPSEYGLLKPDENMR